MLSKICLHIWPQIGALRLYSDFLFTQRPHWEEPLNTCPKVLPEVHVFFDVLWAQPLAIDSCAIYFHSW